MATKNFKSKEYIGFNLALITTFCESADLSERDGNQSLDANKHRIDQVVDVLREQNELAKLLKEFAKEVGKEEFLEYLKDKPNHIMSSFFKEFPEASVEDATRFYAQVIGGGCFLQNARFNGENPFDNMEKIAEVTTQMITFDLDRGGQLYSMVPNNVETQTIVRNRMSKLGLKDKKVFDMMNDRENQATAAKIINDDKQRQRDEGVPEHQITRAAGAISVIGPNNKGFRAIPLERRGQQAVELVQDGYDDIYIKDYAGQFRTVEESLELAKVINESLKKALEEGKIEKMPRVFWHSHGHKPEVLKALLDSGYVQRVDVCTSSLSGASSHTNMRDFLELQMKSKGFDINDKKYANHPILEQFRQVEYTVDEVSKIHMPFRAANVVSDQEVYESKIAGGAVSALWALINRDWDKISPRIQNLKGIEPERKKTLLLEVLKANHDVWDIAGQFETVTPGATISYDQALKDEIIRIGKGEKTHILDHNPQYKDIVKGRWGKHIAIEEGFFDDKGLRSIYLALDTIKLFADNSLHDEKIKSAYINFMNEIGIDSSSFNRQNKNLEQQIKALDLNMVANAIDKQKDNLPSDLYENLKFELATSKYKPVSEGMHFGLEQVNLLCEKFKVELSEAEKTHWAETILACRTNDKGFGIGKTLFEHLVVNKGVGRVGEIEEERYGDLQTLTNSEEFKKLYSDLTKFKLPKLEDLNKFFEEKGYGTDKKPQSVYSKDRFDRFIKGKFKLSEKIESDIVDNLIKYAERNLTAEQITGFSIFSSRNMNNRKQIERIMENPTEKVWLALKAVVSQFSDDILQIIVKDDNVKKIKDLLETKKEFFSDKIANEFGYSTKKKEFFQSTDRTDWLAEALEGRNSKDRKVLDSSNSKGL